MEYLIAIITITYISYLLANVYVFITKINSEVREKIAQEDRLKYEPWKDGEDWTGTKENK